MSATLKQIEKYEQKFTKARKLFLADGKITPDEQARLDAIEKKIDRLLIALASEGEIVVVSEPPPAPPRGENGMIDYQGIPVEKLDRDYEKNVARRNERRVERGVKSVDGWARDLDRNSQEHGAKQYALQATVSYSDKVNEAFQNDMQKGKVRKLSERVGDDFSRRLESYGKAASELKQNVSLLEAKAFRLAAAHATIQRAESLLEAYDLEQRRDAESAKLAKIEAELAQLNGAIALYKDAAQDPAGTAKKLGLQIAHSLVDKFLVEVLTGGVLEKRMQEIKQRIAAINQRLDKLKLAGLQASLDEALNTFSAVEKESEQVREAITQAKREQADAISALARMEARNPGTTTVFGELDAYYDNVQAAGEAALESSEAYEASMNGAQSAMKYTEEIRLTVARDRSNMRVIYEGDWANLEYLQRDEAAKRMIEYTKQMDEWYASQQVDEELARQRTLQKDLLKNQQFDYVGQLVDAAKKRL